MDPKTLKKANSHYKRGTNALVVSLDHKAAQPDIEKARQLYRQIGDREAEAQCLQILGEIRFQLANYDGARQALEEARSSLHELADRDEAFCTFRLADLAFRRADYDAARQGFGHAVDLYRHFDDPEGEANGTFRLGELALQRADYDAARQAFEEALRLYRVSGLPGKTGVINCNRRLEDLRQHSTTSADIIEFPGISLRLINNTSKILNRTYNNNVTISSKERPNHRVGKHNVAGHFGGETVAALRELMDRERTIKQRRVTVEGILARGLQLVFEERGEDVPAELLHKAERPAPTVARVQRNVRKLNRS